jgi:uncharacterized membrane protein YgaE (UPF0421/DUF939 family)
MTVTPPAGSRPNLRRLRTMLLPILETAGAAVAAWYLAKLLFGHRETGFAAIAAVICLGATMGQQRERALELTGGVVVGVLIADLLVGLLGSGPPQVGLMVVLAMSAAVLVGGGTLLMTEAAVSAIIIGSHASSSLGVFPVRPLEALVGGGVAFAVHSLLFPPDPLLHVGRAANEVFSGLGRTLRDVLAGSALVAARSIDDDVRALSDALALGRETARLAPRRRSARGLLERQEEIARHLDFAVRNTRVLARDTLRYARNSGPPVPDLADAVDDLGQALWALAAAFDESGDREEPRLLALRAAARASEAMARHDNLTLIEIAGQIRSTAADLMRASHAGTPDDSGLPEASTEELLTAPPPHGAPAAARRDGGA